MANRYWVGNNNTWNSTAGTKWATTSGGAGGASVPTSADDVFFDANSFNAPGQSVTLSGTVICKTLDFTGVTNNPNVVMSAGARIHGSLILSADMTTSGGGTGSFNMAATSGTWTIDTKGITLYGYLSIGYFTISGSTAVFNQMSDLVMVTSQGYSFQFDPDSSPARVYNTNNYNITMSSSGGTSPLFALRNGGGIFNAGSSIITSTYTGIDYNAISGFEIEASGVTFNEGTCVVNLINCSLTIRNTGVTVPEINMTGNVSQPITIEIQEGSVVEVMTITDPSGASTYYWYPGIVARIVDFTANGDSSFPLVFRTAYDRTDGEWGINCDTVAVSYIDVQDSTATGPASPFYDFPGGVDSGNNSGWFFSEPQLPVYDPSLISAVKAINQNTNFPHFIIGGKGTGASNYALFKKSTTYGFHLWRSPVYMIGQQFDVQDITFPIFPAISGNMEIKPVLYFDNETVISPGELINVTTYPNGDRLIKLSAKNFQNKVSGKSNFFLELQSLGTDLAVVGLPIDIGIEVKED